MDEEIGIQDERLFAAFLEKHTAPTLFTQFIDEPFAFLRERLTWHLEKQHPGTVLTRMTITNAPVPRGDGHPNYDRPDYDPDADKPSTLILTRVALYVPFTARVITSPNTPEWALHGALTCVIGNLNQPDNQVLQTWMEADETGEGRLLMPDNEQFRERMLSVGQWLPSDYPPGSPEREGLEA